jgi:hypothetical protein
MSCNQLRDKILKKQDFQCFRALKTTDPEGTEGRRGSLRRAVIAGHEASVREGKISVKVI